VILVTGYRHPELPAICWVQAVFLRLRRACFFRDIKNFGFTRSGPARWRQLGDRPLFSLQPYLRGVGAGLISSRMGLPWAGHFIASPLGCCWGCFWSGWLAACGCNEMKELHLTIQHGVGLQAGPDADARVSRRRSPQPMAWGSQIINLATLGGLAIYFWRVIHPPTISASSAPKFRS